MHCIYVYIRECYLRFYLQYFWYLPLWSTSLLPSIRSVSPSLKYFAFTFNTFCISLFEVLRFYLQYVLYHPLWSTSLLPSILFVSPSLKYFAFTFNTFCISLFEILRKFVSTRFRKFFMRESESDPDLTHVQHNYLSAQRMNLTLIL